jgi:hypothetical protein
MSISGLGPAALARLDALLTDLALQAKTAKTRIVQLTEGRGLTSSPSTNRWMVSRSVWGLGASPSLPAGPYAGRVVPETGSVSSQGWPVIFSGCPAAVMSGQRDPKVLAAMARGRMRARDPSWWRRSLDTSPAANQDLSAAAVPPRHIVHPVGVEHGRTCGRLLVLFLWLVRPAGVLRCRHCG